MSLTLTPVQTLPVSDYDEPPYLLMRRSLQQRRASLEPNAAEVLDETPLTHEEAEAKLEELKEIIQHDWWYFHKRIDRIDPRLLSFRPERDWDITTWWEQTCLPQSEEL